MHKIKSKKLVRKAQTVLEKLENIKKMSNGYEDFQFTSQDQEVKQMLYSSIDNLKSFIDNIDNPYFTSSNKNG